MNDKLKEIKSIIDSKIDIVPQFEDIIWEFADKETENMRRDMEDLMFSINFMKKLLKLNNTDIITFIISKNKITINNKYIDYDIFLKFNKFLYEHTNVDLINQSDNIKTTLELDSYVKLLNILKIKFDSLNKSVQEIYENGAKEVSNILDAKNELLASLNNVFDYKYEELIEKYNNLLNKNKNPNNKNSF